MMKYIHILLFLCLPMANMFAVECPNNPAADLFTDCSNNTYPCSLLDNYNNGSCDNGLDCSNENTDCVNFSCI